MKMQRVLYQLSADGPSFWGAAVLGNEFDGNIKYIIGAPNTLVIYDKWFYAQLSCGPLAYLDTVPESQMQPAKK